MRLLLRVSILGALTVVFLIVLAIRSSHRTHLTLEQQETGKNQKKNFLKLYCV